MNNQDDIDGVPDSDPDHIDPAGDVADLVEANIDNIKLDENQDVSELREFINSVENSEDPVDPGTVATVRMARAMLKKIDND
jgi:hypothetical protein